MLIETHPEFGHLPEGVRLLARHRKLSAPRDLPCTRCRATMKKASTAYMDEVDGDLHTGKGFYCPTCAAAVAKEARTRGM